MNLNKILCVVDLSYWMYYTLFGATSEFLKRYPEIASVWLKDPEEVDLNNLPNLTNCIEYARVLKQWTMKRIETIDYLLKQECQTEIDAADSIDIVFALDDRLKNNFRKSLYSEYKAHRALQKRSYNLQLIKDYILNVIFPDLDVYNKHGIKLLKVDGAEGDDVIATLLMHYRSKYMKTVLIASDHDFLLIPDVCQIDMFGRKITRTIANEELSPEDYLLHKILVGDSSDNIPNIAPRMGEKTALKYVKDKEMLKTLLKENQDAAKQFMLNKQIISFNSIPKELTESILKECNNILLSDIKSENVDFTDFMMI